MLGQVWILSNTWTTLLFLLSHCPSPFQLLLLVVVPTVPEHHDCLRLGLLSSTLLPLPGYSLSNASIRNSQLNSLPAPLTYSPWQRPLLRMMTITSPGSIRTKPILPPVLSPNQTFLSTWRQIWSRPSNWNRSHILVNFHNVRRSCLVCFHIFQNSVHMTSCHVAPGCPPSW